MTLAAAEHDARAPSGRDPRRRPRAGGRSRRSARPPTGRRRAAGPPRGTPRCRPGRPGRPPCGRARRALSHAARCSGSRSRSPAGTAITRSSRATPTGAGTGIGRDQASAGSYRASTSNAALASATVRVKVVTQSSDRHAGSTPEVEIRPLVALTPTMPLNAAGTRPEPAVSVPSASATSPEATATPEPELLPPRDVQRRVDARGRRRTGCGCRPARWRTGPCWSCPTGIAPAASSRSTAKADALAGLPARPGTPRSVGTPATSMLSLTAKVTPSSGPPGATSAVSTAISSRRRAGGSTSAGRSSGDLGGCGLGPPAPLLGECARRRAAVKATVSGSRPAFCRSASRSVAGLRLEPPGARRRCRPAACASSLGGHRLEPQPVEHPQQPRRLVARRRRSATPAPCARQLVAARALHAVDAEVDAADAHRVGRRPGPRRVVLRGDQPVPRIERYGDRRAEVDVAQPDDEVAAAATISNTSSRVASPLTRRMNSTLSGHHGASGRTEVW